MQDALAENPELYYRKADGFTTLIKHPTLSPGEIEEIQRGCFKEDFERLGPSVFRVVETWLLGWQKLKDSANSLLKKKADYFARGARGAYPLFLAGRLLGPNARVRRWIGDLEKRLHEAFGKPTALAALILPLALVTLYFAWRENFSRHVKIARWTLPLWLYVSITGIAVYWMLYTR